MTHRPSAPGSALLVPRGSMRVALLLLALMLPVRVTSAQTIGVTIVRDLEHWLATSTGRQAAQDGSADLAHALRSEAGQRGLHGASESIATVLPVTVSPPTRATPRIVHVGSESKWVLLRDNGTLATVATDRDRRFAVPIAWSNLRLTVSERDLLRAFTDTLKAMQRP